MGYAIISKNANIENFYRNNSGWWSIWNYCDYIFPELAAKTRLGGLDAGGGPSGENGLDIVQSLELAVTLQYSVADGRATDYAWKEEYPENEDDVKMFVKEVKLFSDFLVECGGFDIY